VLLLLEKSMRAYTKNKSRARDVVRADIVKRFTMVVKKTEGESGTLSYVSQGLRVYVPTSVSMSVSMCTC